MALPHLVVTLLQATMLFVLTYAVFVLIPHVAIELRTKLWIMESDPDVYFDKWDIIHWGSALLATLTWPEESKRRIVAYSGFFVAAIFEMYEQFYLCGIQQHHESCEPWQDTTKDILTAVIGIIIALYHPNIVTALGHNETLFWTLATLIFMPHWWWYGLLLYTAIVVILNAFYKSPLICRTFCATITLIGAIIRYTQGTIDITLLFPTVTALAGIMAVVIFVKSLDRLRPQDNITKKTDEIKIKQSPPKKQKKHI